MLSSSSSALTHCLYQLTFISEMEQITTCASGLPVIQAMSGQWWWQCSAVLMIWWQWQVDCAVWASVTQMAALSLHLKSVVVDLSVRAVHRTTTSASPTSAQCQLAGTVNGRKWESELTCHCQSRSLFLGLKKKRVPIRRTVLHFLMTDCKYAAVRQQWCTKQTMWPKLILGIIKQQTSGHIEQVDESCRNNTFTNRMSCFCKIPVKSIRKWRNKVDWLNVENDLLGVH